MTTRRDKLEKFVLGGPATRRRVALFLALVGVVVLLLAYQAEVVDKYISPLQMVAVSGSITFYQAGYDSLFATPQGMDTNGSFFVFFQQASGDCAVRACTIWDGTLGKCPQFCTYTALLPDAAAYNVSLFYQVVNAQGNLVWASNCNITTGSNPLVVSVHSEAYEQGLICSS